ncbi:hypothetical protein VmeM32_00229 [Vibrio phage vB_VmeM-32]|nr:hypothetical protein VmeM32_00229 [Vibrio phage vB_VmeM-32]
MNDPIKTIRIHQQLTKYLAEHDLVLMMGRVFDKDGNFLVMVDWSKVDVNRPFDINDFPEVLPFLK